MKYLKFLFSPILMGILFVIFAIAMAVATFIENDFGSPAAYSMVYNTKWFELVLLLLAVNLTGRMFELKLYRKDKLPVFVFHLAFIVMIIGAAITRYFGWEGIIHIREGEEQNICYSGEKYIGYNITDAAGKQIGSRYDKYAMTSVSADDYSKKVVVNNNNYEVVLARILPNAAEVISETASGKPVITLLISQDMAGRESVTLKEGEVKTAGGISFGFASELPADINIIFSSDAFFASSKLNMGKVSMMTQEVSPLQPGEQIELNEMQILSLNGVKIVPQQLIPSGELKVVSINPAEQKTGQNAFIFHITSGNKSETVYLWDIESENAATGSVVMDGNRFELTYGSRATELPFAIRLNDFIFERYPGSNSPSGYKSDVVLVDKGAGVEKPFMIYMNNILKYKGYRFYQSSYDQDEKGTILSVNHDQWGMMVTYAGYILLFLFIILALVAKNTVFRNVTPGHWQSNLRKLVPVLILVFILSGLSGLNAQKLVPDKSVSEEIGKVLVQDQKGRTKPLFTLSNDILRKVTRKNDFEGLTSMQVFLGIYLDFNNWKDIPLITVSNGDLQKKLGISGKYAAFSNIVDLNNGGKYKIAEDVNAAYEKSPGDRNKFDKEVMKIDERVNIVYMIAQGDFMKMFPLRNNTNDWGSSAEALKFAANSSDSAYIQSIMPVLNDAINTNNITKTKQVTTSVGEYQTRFAQYDLPSKTKVGSELLYYKLSIFERLFPFYATIGLIMLIGLITMVIRGTKETTKFVKVLGIILFIGFLFHTFGLGLRWYIAGRSPMSNGYESMIFISWVTIIAGFIFSRKSAFALSATAVLASMTLLVAHLSFMDPEITNLVPVLKSYWLTLHVSIITGSYGFLGLGAILGLITMVLLALSNDKNRGRIAVTIDELAVINYKTLTLGLYFLTIGTFLGAVWANESWGRYWGWDPKETWSLITIIIYSLVVHSRSIPGMKDIYTFNLISLFAFSSVLMTYFGVNYYLSGMHSYASGDPVPVPSFVYVAVILISGLSIFAYYKYAAPQPKENKKK